MDAQSMRDYISNFSLDKGPRGNQGYSRVLLQIFGYLGHGKSSFINSCKYVLDDGSFTTHAEVTESHKGTTTMIRHKYELTGTITIVDNRGCAKMEKNEIGEIYAQLGNFLPLEKEVNWHSGFKDMMELLLQSERQDVSSDFLVPVLIYSADCLLVEQNVNEMKEILIAARNITGLFPTVVLTHELSKHLSEVKESFRRMGVKNMFSLENYTMEDHKKTRGKHETILSCLQGIIKDVEFRMLDERDAISERIDRKRFLLEFAHRKEMERKQERERRFCFLL